MARSFRWFDNVIGFDVASGSQNLRSLMGGITLDAGRRSTIARILFSGSWASQTVVGVWGTEVISWGIGISSQEVFAAGIVPDPETEAEFPETGWLMRDRFLISQSSGDSPVVHNRAYDLRAQRKVGTGELYLVSTQGPIDGTSFASTFHGMCRVLVRLP